MKSVVNKNRRHHGVVQTHAKAIRKTGDWTVEVDRVVPGASSTLRPDLVCRNTTSGRAVVLDVKCPFDTTRAFTEAAERNEAKYAAVARELGADLLTFSVGALGSWTAANDNIMRRTFRLPQPAKLRDQLLRHVLHWSRNTYVHFTTGVPQSY